MNTLNLLKSTGKFGKFYFKYRGFTPYPIVLLFIFFAEPTPQTFLWGMLLITGGELLRIWSVAYIGKETRSREVFAETLVTAGPYAYLRNPLYLGNMLIYTGATIIADIWMPYFLLLVWIYFAIQYWAIIRLEEEVLTETFAEDYARYKSQVPSFLPGVFSTPPAPPAVPDYRSALISEKSTFLSTLAVLAILVVRMVV